jgi:type 1 glutamine amidotransferase
MALPRVLAITGGHSFDRVAFGALLDSLPFDVTWVEHPEARSWLDPDRLSDFAAVLHYDMPGGRLEPEPVPAEVTDGIAGLVEAGHGFVVLHHALASWPGWPGWADLVGGQFRYAPGMLRGRAWPDSGFRHAVAQHLTPMGDHPVLAGLEEGLDLVDETYLCPVFEDEVVPLLRTDAPITDALHTSTLAAMRSGNEHEPVDPTWHHPPGSDLAAWCREHGRSRWVYIQPGDTAATLADPGYRRLVANALTWAQRRQPR